MKKCKKCNLILPTSDFRDHNKQCNECNRSIQRINRAARKINTGNRFDPTFRITPLQKKAIKCLRENGFKQKELASVFHCTQGSIWQILNNYRVGDSNDNG